MAHGSKKWIRDCLGRERRSADRTAIDYWRPVRNVGPDKKYNNWDYTRKQQGTFCPQCRQVAKAAYTVVETTRPKRDLYAEYHALYGEAIKVWEEYVCQPLVVRKNGQVYRSVGYPQIARPPEYYVWRRGQPTEPRAWSFDDRSFMCNKHRRIDELQHTMWRSSYPGKKSYRSSYRRLELQHYRAKVRQAIREERFDDIPSFVDRQLWW